MLESRAWWPALLLGLAFGLGLNAKYAMAWFIVCLGVYPLGGARPPRAPQGCAALPRAGDRSLLLAPNLLWNASHGFATLSHTADNAKWTGPLVNPLRALNSLGAQFGVFGPICLRD